MNAAVLFSLSLFAAPVEPAAEATEDSPEPVTTVALQPAAGGPLSVGLVVGEPTALRFDYDLNPKTRAFGLLGMAHRIDAFSFAFDAPMLAAGAEQDVLVLDNMGTRSGTIAVGLQADLWLRSYYTSSKPLLAMELPVSFRLASPAEPLAFYAIVAPGYYLAPHTGPSLSVCAGFSYRLPGAGSRPVPRDEPASEGQVEAAQPESSVQPDAPAVKPEPKPEPKPQRKGRRRLSR